MQCSSCSAENPDAARFCNQCGSALAAACPRCGHLNSRAGRFCSECGAPLATSTAEPRFSSPQAYTPRLLAERILRDRSAMEGEYKQVTVLFADVAGFTALAETLDPETTYTLMQQCFDRMLEEVHRYEGTVTQFLGDGILALFGAPIAHEDHAQRAVRAALGIQQALRAYQQELQQTRGIRFQMRIGLNSGPVVVGTIGTDLNMTYTALGDTVNLGDRVQALAEPGTVVISQNTYHLVSGYFVTRPLGEHQVKGKAAAVAAYEVLRPRRWRSRVDVAAERGLTPLVGREPELELLLDRYAAAREGRGQIVLVQGEAGIGKSRLLYELKPRLVEEELSWLEGRCISYGRDIAYLPIIDLLKDCFEIEEMDAEEAIVRKVEAGVRPFGTGMTAGEPFLRYLLAVDTGDSEAPGAVATMDPQMRKLRLFEAVRDLLIAAAGLRPLVITIEDLHWIDLLSEEFLVSFATTVPQHPILLLLTARRGYDHRFGSPADVTRIDLQSLSEPESARVARGLLGADEMPAELQALITRKAEGNPFFVEEVTRSLLETGALGRLPGGSGYVLARRLEEVVVPDTVQDVIMARLDRLPEEPKRALQTASVIGREFTARLLERAAELQGRAEEYLGELQSVELIFERSVYPELAYMFKHALTHDVAYHSLLVARRKILHRRVGDAIEVLYRDRLAEQYEALAYHFEHAEAWEKALEYLQKSSEKALATFAPQQAVAFYDRALAAAEKSGEALLPERAMALHHGRGQALFLTNEWETSVESFQTMLRAPQGVGNRAQEGMALYWLSQTCFWAHRFEDARDYAERARLLAIDRGEQALLAGSLNMKALVALATGDLMNARMAVEEAERIARQAGLPTVLAQALHFAGLLAHWCGDHARALEQFDEGLQISRQHQVPHLLLGLLLMEGFVHCGRGEYEQARQYLEEDLELSARLGDKIWRPRALNTLGWVYMDLCQWEVATRYNAQSAAEARVLGDPETIRNAELNLADCYLALGQWDEAQRTLETVHEECQGGGALGAEMAKWRYTQHLHASLGELCLARGDTAKALEFAEACLTAAEATQSRRNIVKGRRLKGEVFLTRGRLEEAETEIEEALRVAREVGNPAQIRMTLAALGRLRQAQERPEEARAAYQEALAVVEAVAGSLSDAALRETLLASPQVAALREEAVR